MRSHFCNMELESQRRNFAGKWRCASGKSVEGGLEGNNLSGAHRLIGGEDNAEAVDGVAHMISQVYVFANCLEEVRLLTVTEFLVVGLVRRVDNFVFSKRIAASVKRGMMYENPVSFCV